MSSDDINLKLDKLLKNDDTENFYSFVSEIIDENKEYVSDLEQNLNLIFNILITDINESNHESKMSFICLFFEILISENIDFTFYLDKLLNLIIKTNIYSDENIKRIINIFIPSLIFIIFSRVKYYIFLRRNFDLICINKR